MNKNSCLNCVDHLSVCNAECCKQFKIAFNPRYAVKKGLLVQLHSNDEEYKLYMRLHGARIHSDDIVITLDDFERRGRYLLIHSRCKLLSEDNKCLAHNGEYRRPKMCDYPNKDGVVEGIYLTPNCVFLQADWYTQGKEE